MFDAAKDTFSTVFIEKDDAPELIQKHDVVYFPTLLWTDGAGEELIRSVRAADSDEVLGDQVIAMELLNEDASGQ